MKESNNEPQILYAELKKYRKAIGEVCKRHGCHRNWVYLVMMGNKWTDKKMLIVAAEVLIEFKTKEIEINKSMSLVKQAIAIQV